MKSAGRGEQRERESDLDDDEWIARQKTPAAPDEIIAGVFLQIADHAIARKLQRRAEGERDRANKTENKGHRQDRQIWARVPNEIERKQVAHRHGEKL